MQMIKRSSEIMPLSARISSRVYGVELTGTPWIISNKVEVARHGENASIKTIEDNRQNKDGLEN
jgi:hypothetical protein